MTDFSQLYRLHVGNFQKSNTTLETKCLTAFFAAAVDLVREIFMIHVGGTRCVTSSTDNIMKIHARRTLKVEFIRGYIFKY